MRFNRRQFDIWERDSIGRATRLDPVVMVVAFIVLAMCMLAAKKLAGC